MTKSVFIPGTSRRSILNYGNILLGLSLAAFGIIFMYIMYFSNIPKPFSGDGFITSEYIGAVGIVIAGIGIPFCKLGVSNKAAWAWAIGFMACAGLMLYCAVHM